MRSQTSVRQIGVEPSVSLSVETASASHDINTLNRVDEIWQSARSSEHSSLFNGNIYTVRSIQSDHITVQPAEYKHYFAQLSDPGLSEKLNLRPLACSGFLTCSDGLILAKRSNAVTLDKGKWELAPAGTFDEDCVVSGLLDARVLILKEMSEELGLPADALGPTRICAAFEDIQTRAVDLILRAHIALSEAKVRSFFQAKLSMEYTELAVVSLLDIQGFIEQNNQALSPISRAALAHVDIRDACSPSG